MQEFETWRDLLGKIIRDPREKQRLIEELKVTPITLTRWVNGESDPRPQNLRLLMNSLPQYREQLRVLIRDDRALSELATFPTREEAREIPSEFYARVLVARATTSEHVRFWSTCHLILQQALGQLDHDRQGLCVWVIRCMPPSGPLLKVRSLRESVGLGTSPWPSNLEHMAMFLGAASLAGNAVTLCRPQVVQDLAESNITPLLRSEHEKSVAIYPILFAGRIAGVFLVSSVQRHFFAQQWRTDLSQRYADLSALAFHPDEVYAPDRSAVCVMPSLEKQREHFATFRQLVAQTIHLAAHANKPINNLQADLLVWQQLEDTLLALPLLESTS